MRVPPRIATEHITSTDTTAHARASAATEPAPPPCEDTVAHTGCCIATEHTGSSIAVSMKCGFLLSSKAKRKSSATAQAMPHTAGCSLDCTGREGFATRPGYPRPAAEHLVAASHATPALLARTIFEMFASTLAIATNESAVLRLCLHQDRTDAQMYRRADAISNMIQRANAFQEVFKDEHPRNVPSYVLHLVAFKKYAEEVLLMPKSVPMALKEAKWNTAKKHLQCADMIFKSLANIDWDALDPRNNQGEGPSSEYLETCAWTLWALWPAALSSE